MSKAYATEGYPRCTTVIQALDEKHWRDPRMCKPYWAACVIAERIPEENLKAVGYDYRDWQAVDTFPRLEAALGMRDAPRPSKALSLTGKPFEQLKAFLGSRGAHPGSFQTDDDFWQCAMHLWPSHIRRGETLGDLLAQIQGMSKAQRKSARRM